MIKSLFETGDRNERFRLFEELRAYLVVGFGALSKPSSCRNVYSLLPAEHQDLLYATASSSSWADASGEDMIERAVQKSLTVGLTGNLIIEDSDGWALSELGQEVFTSVMEKFEDDPSRYPSIPAIIQGTIQA